ncbi:MAG: hypothetical protein B7Y56_12675 [Gallionellales bacterium 35-53-114]|jgi:hypothetical protein|nr:MAG: hypothetical protein B7Y56_12675 [Gallionellales bacterium 35-53-114]OYZ63456.1 MAG: hypothetical protein B7Y04_08885 [Gallionellales bacterium 24-53-125]OZB10931.1 MAG: hypothetical protein B7X61_00805 [Gallionellales bacterium 39-52-133]HQS58887.1 hypothetical protein [Gallionellaceae bacterium]HQS75728.1 hypothetical protein [Gallionellaceae bacterium]
MFEHLGEYFKWVMPPYHLNLFSKKGMEALLKRSGFEVVETHSMPRNWYFFESVANKIGLSNEKLSEVDKLVPGLSLEVDRIFDEICLKYSKSSAVWMLAKSL